MAKLLAGVVGLSDGIYHLEAFVSSADVGRIVLCDPDNHQLDTLRQQFPKIGAVYRDVEEMLLHEKPDIASVATSSDNYLDCATAVLHAGANLILAKPFAEQLGAYEEIVRSAAEKGVKLMITQEARFRPRFVKIREMIERGFFGEIIHVRLDGALTTNDPVQEIDLLSYLVGEEIVGVSAISNKRSALDSSGGKTVCALFRFAGGCIGKTTIDTSKQENVAESTDDRFRLIGSKGIAVGHRAYADGFDAWTTLPKDQNEARTGTLAAVNSFVRSLTLAFPVTTSSEDALVSLRLRQAVDRALTSEPQIFAVS